MTASYIHYIHIIYIWIDGKHLMSHDTLLLSLLLFCFYNINYIIFIKLNYIIYYII